MSVVDREFAYGRLQLKRSDADKRPLLHRLSRIEGQIRAIRRMVEADEYSLDEVHQINAVTAAIREFALAIIAQHLEAGVATASQAEGSGHEAITNVLRVLRVGIRVDR